MAVYVPFNYSGPSALGKLLHSIVRRDVTSGFAIFEVTPENVFSNPLNYGYSLLFSIGLLMTSAFIWYMIYSGLVCRKCNVDCCDKKSDEYKRAHRGEYKGYWIGIVAVFGVFVLVGVILQWIYSAALHTDSKSFIESKWNEANDFTIGAVSNATKLENLLIIDRQLANDSLESTCLPPDPFQLRVDLEADAKVLDDTIDVGHTVLQQAQQLNLTQYEQYKDAAEYYLNIAYPVLMSLGALWILLGALVTVAISIEDMEARDALLDCTSSVLIAVQTFIIPLGVVFFAISIVISDPCMDPYPWINHELPSDGTTGETLQIYLYCPTPFDGGPINDNLDIIETNLLNISSTADSLLVFANQNCSTTTLPVTAYVYTARLNDTEISLNETRIAVSCIQPHAILVDTLNRLCHPMLENFFMLGWTMIGIPVFLGLFITIAARPCTTYVSEGKYRQKSSDEQKEKKKKKRRRSESPPSGESTEYMPVSSEAEPAKELNTAAAAAADDDSDVELDDDD